MFPLTSGLFTWRWGPQVSEVTCGGLPHLSCKRDHIKMREYMDRQVIPPHLSGVPTSMYWQARSQGKHQDSQENKTNCFPRDLTLSVWYTMLSKNGNSASQLKIKSWKSVTFTNKVWKNSRYFVGVFNEQLFHSRLLDMRWLQPTRRVPSYFQRALVE